MAESPPSSPIGHVGILQAEGIIAVIFSKLDADREQRWRYRGYRGAAADEARVSWLSSVPSTKPGELHIIEQRRGGVPDYPADGARRGELRLMKGRAVRVPPMRSASRDR